MARCSYNIYNSAHYIQGHHLPVITTHKIIIKKIIINSVFLFKNLAGCIYRDFKYMELDIWPRQYCCSLFNGIHIIIGALGLFPRCPGFHKIWFASVGSSLSLSSSCMIFRKPRKLKLWDGQVTFDLANIHLFSSSGLKCLISPWTGQAAPSARAQMVWPSIWIWKLC